MGYLFTQRAQRAKPRTRRRPPPDRGAVPRTECRDRCRRFGTWEEPLLYQAALCVAAGMPHAPEPLERANLRRWFDQARGARALINGSDIRLAVDEPHLSAVLHRGSEKEEIALVLRGLGRLRGEIPLTYVARVLESRRGRGAPRLPEAHRREAAFQR